MNAVREFMTRYNYSLTGHSFMNMTFGDTCTWMFFPWQRYETVGENALLHVYFVLTILFLTSLSGVLVCGVSLVTEMCRVNPETLSHFRRVSECWADV